MKLQERLGEPDYINDEGTFWWSNAAMNSYMRYCKPPLPYLAYQAESIAGDTAHFIINTDGEILYKHSDMSKVLSWIATPTLETK